MVYSLEFMSQKYIKSQNKISHNASSYGKYYATAVRLDQESSAAQIDTWHRKDNHGKLGIGYHYVAREYADLQPK